MARGTSLATLLSMLKAELGLSLTVGTQRDTELGTLLASTQKFLTVEYDWPFLEDMWDVSAAGKTASIPTTARAKGATTSINTERPISAFVKYNDEWMPLEYGIGPEEYNTYDSDAGDTSDPIQRWQFFGAGAIEFWPVPETPQDVRFIAQREVPALATNNAELDDLLIVYFCAADLLAKADSKNAPSVYAKAQQRLARLRGAYPNRDRAYIVGSGGGEAVRTIPMKITVHS